MNPAPKNEKKNKIVIFLSQQQLLLPYMKDLLNHAGSHVHMYNNFIAPY